MIYLDLELEIPPFFEKIALCAKKFGNNYPTFKIQSESVCRYVSKIIIQYLKPMRA